MVMRMKYLVSILLTSWGLASYAQNEQDALALSRDEVTGSARSVSMGGAFTALGGDVSGSYLNPAGIAVYRSSEFSLSPAFHTNITGSDYYSTTTLGTKTNVNIATLGLVGVNNLKQNGKWRSTSMALGMHRAYSFHRQYTISGKSIPNSLLDSYQRTLETQNISPEQLGSSYPAYPFDIFLAWNNYLIDTLQGVNGYYNASGVRPVEQRYEGYESGAKRETYFAFGGNYDDILYIGGALNFSRIQFDRSYTHSESIDPTDSTTVLREFSFSYDESFSGLGTALNIGIIYRPITPLRIGASIKTPTLYSLELQYESDNTAIYTEDRVFSTRSPQIGKYEFRLSTPFQANIGMAYVIGKFGLLSVDAQYLDYQSIKMGGITDGYSFNEEEKAIRSSLQPVINIRSGAEFRIDQNWSLRAGFAHYGNPYRSNILNDGSFRLYSAGFGYKTEEFFIDGSYQMKSSTEEKYLFDASLVDAASIHSSDHRFTCTVGFKF
jgi:hypothetical protein